MLGNFGRRAVELTVLFLALYAFAFVPLGKRTGLEHAKAILGTHAAESARRELAFAADRLWKKLTGAKPEPEPAIGRRGTPAIPRMPQGRAPENVLLAPAVEPPAPEAPPLRGDSPDASL